MSLLAVIDYPTKLKIRRHAGCKLKIRDIYDKKTQILSLGDDDIRPHQTQSLNFKSFYWARMELVATYQILQVCTIKSGSPRTKNLDGGNFISAEQKFECNVQMRLCPYSCTLISVLV